MMGNGETTSLYTNQTQTVATFTSGQQEAVPGCESGEVVMNFNDLDLPQHAQVAHKWIAIYSEMIVTLTPPAVLHRVLHRATNLCSQQIIIML